MLFLVSFIMYMEETKKHRNEIDIIDFLTNYISKEIIFIPNPGNAGDSLISMGTLQLLDKIGLNYTMGDINKQYSNKILFYGGGGNLVGLYKNCYNFINKNRNTNEIVILPHTIKNVDSFLSLCDENIKIICREYISYDYVYSKIKQKNNVFLSKDMAFYIDGLESYKNIQGVGECNCFRIDCEKTNIKIPSNNTDISETLRKKNNTSDPHVINSVSLSMFNYLSKFKIINTNRLHVAIAGSLLGKHVNLYQNNYYKIKAVYDYSIKDNFENTYLCD